MKNNFPHLIFTLLLFSFFSLNLKAQIENKNSNIDAITPSDYDDLICNGWIYNFLSSFSDSCFTDTSLVDTLMVDTFEYNANGIDTFFIINTDLYSFRITETCYDLSFGVVESNDEFQNYYYQSTINYFDIIQNTLEGSVNGTPIPQDSIIPLLEEANLWTENAVLGFNTSLLTDCTGTIELVCYNDSICYNAINSVSLADTILTEDIQLDTIGIPIDPNFEYFELWNYTNQNQTACDDNSKRINPCDTCNAQLITMIEMLPDTCEESVLSVVLKGQYNYEFCDLNNVEIDYNVFLNRINLELEYMRADTFEFCTECGTEYADTIVIGSLDADTYSINAINVFNDSILSSITIDIIDCIAPFCPTPESSFLQTEFTPDCNTILSYTGSIPYLNFSWRIKECSQAHWTDLGMTNIPEITLSNLVEETDYCWQVIGLCSQSSSLWSNEVTFLTPKCTPQVPLLAQPINGSMDMPLTINFNWKDLDNAETYRIQISDDVTFLNIIENQSGLIDTSHVFSVSNFESTYYWRVKAVNASGESDWSEIWSFTTENAPLEVVNLISPPNASIDVELLPTLNWSSAQNAENYHIQLASDFDFTEIVTEDNSLLETNFTTPSLDYCATYYWRVRIKNQASLGPWSETWSFSTIKGFNITVEGEFEFCEGGNTTLTASGGSSYNWDTGIDSTSITVSSAGDYTVIVTDDNGCTDTETVSVFVNDLPDVGLNLVKDTFCINEASSELIGGTPFGGNYSGAGITAGLFDPSIAGAGTHFITYTYTDTNGCSNFDSQEIVVENVDCTSGTSGLVIHESVKIYPNPSKGNISIILRNWKGPINIKLYDIKGRMIHSDNKESNRFRIENIPIGIYMLKASNYMHHISKKIIVE